MKDLNSIPEPPEPPAGFAETDKTKRLDDKESFFEKIFAKKMSTEKKQEQEAQQKDEVHKIAEEIKKPEEINKPIIKENKVKQNQLKQDQEEKPVIQVQVQEKKSFFSSLFNKKDSAEQEFFRATAVPIAIQETHENTEAYYDMHNPIPLPEEFEAEVKELEQDLQALDIQNSKKNSAIKLIKPIVISKPMRNINNVSATINSAVINKQKQIIVREQELLDYYNSLKHAEISMSKRYKDIQKREYNLISQEERLKHIEISLKEKEASLQMKEEEMIAEEIQQKEIKIMLDKEETAIVNKVKELEKDKRAIDDKENELLITLERFELQKRNISRLSKEADAKEKHLDEREKQFHPMELTLEQKKAELEMKEEEIMKIEKEIKENKALIDKEEQSITGKFNKIELDLALISEKENEIIATYKKLTTLKSTVTKREQLVKTRQDEMQQIINENKSRAKELDRISKTLAEKEKIIMQTLENLKKYDELLKSKQEMEQIVERLQKRVRDEYKKLESIHKIKNRNIDENVAFYHETKDIQTEFDQQDTAIPLEEIHNVLSVQSIQQSQQGSKDQESIVSVADDRQQGDLLTMIDETNSLIKEKKYDEANTYLGRIMNEYEKIDSGHVKKRELYYEILGLKNEIKLALLKA